MLLGLLALSAMGGDLCVGPVALKCEAYSLLDFLNPILVHRRQTLHDVRMRRCDVFHF